MDYWEFLLQKEGDRTWLPIKSPKLDLEVGRYRVVAHSNRANTDVEICVTHTNTNETPPKRRYQKRSRQTNPDGLMVIIPFTYLKPGLWELRCCGDIMSDFLGNSWQETVQLSVFPPKVNQDLNQPKGSLKAQSQGQNAEDEQKVEENKIKNDITPKTVNRKPADIEELHSPLIPSSHRQETEEVHPTEKPVAIADNDSLDSSNSTAPPAPSPFPTDLPSLAQIALPQTQTPIAAPVTAKTDTDYADSHQTNGKTRNEEETTPSKLNATSPSSEAFPELKIQGTDIPIPTAHPSPSPISNPILDQSLQVLEQVLQQVLDPVIKEFEESEASELPIPIIATESEFPLEDDTPWQGLILTLDEEALVLQRGEPLTVAGQVDWLNVHQLDVEETVLNQTNQFQGILHYELRHPQTGQIVVDVQKPIATQTFPVAFSQTLDIPSDSKTCLLLGKVNLYGSMETALASQPFTVTVDLDELLVAVQSGSWTKENATPVASTPKPKSPSTPLNQTFLELVDNPKSRQPLIYQPSSSQPLPPQLYQPESQSKLPKSLDLPTFSQSTPTTGKAFASIEETKHETQARSHSVEPTEKQTTVTTPSISDDSKQVSVLESSVSESPVQETATGENNQNSLVLDTAISEASAQAETVTEAAEPSNDIKPDTPPLEDNLAPIAETSEQVSTKPTEITDVWTSTPNAEFESSQVANPDLSEWKIAAMSSAAPMNQDPIAVDHAFTQLNLDDRFWGRLNALMTDTDLAEWLKVELPPSENWVELEGERLEPESDPLFAQPEDVTLSSDEDIALNNFDESMWDEDTEEVGSLNHDDIPELEPPAQVEHPSLSREELLEREIVVEDEPLTTEPSESEPADSRTVETQGSHLRTSERVQLKIGTPLPTPELFVPNQELAAGEPVLVKIKLTPHSARLGVKLWVQDRQSRSLLDGPRWLMDLSPNKSGELEGLTQLVVPFGTVEIRFEAITVDLDSERESHKVSIDRIVVPPDLSDFSGDEL